MFSLPAARKIKDMSTWGEAGDKRLMDENIGFYTYEEFDNVKEIADGWFGKVYSANWKTSDKVIVLKSFGNYNQNARQVVKDVIIEISNFLDLKQSFIYIYIYSINHLILCFFFFYS